MSKRPHANSDPEPGKVKAGDVRDEDLERRRRALEASLASRQPEGQSGDKARNTSGMSGFGNALKLSSEFIAGVLVGAGLGWVIDHWAGTSPWGLIVFLMLGFGAGVLNVMRSAGMVTEAGIRKPETGSPDEN